MAQAFNLTGVKNVLIRRVDKKEVGLDMLEVRFKVCHQHNHCLFTTMLLLNHNAPYMEVNINFIWTIICSCSVHCFEYKLFVLQNQAMTRSDMWRFTQSLVWSLHPPSISSTLCPSPLPLTLSPFPLLTHSHLSSSFSCGYCPDRLARGCTSLGSWSLFTCQPK